MNRRKLKKIEGPMTSPVNMAFYLGQDHGYQGIKRNPYPPGRRHDYYEYGWHDTPYTWDPRKAMPDGRNV